MSEERELLKRVQKILNQKFDYYLDIEKDIEEYLTSPDDADPVAEVVHVEPYRTSCLVATKGRLDDYPVGTKFYTSPQHKDLSDEEIKKIVLNELDPRDFEKMDFLEYSVLVARLVLKSTNHD